MQKVFTRGRDNPSRGNNKHPRYQRGRHPDNREDRGRHSVEKGKDHLRLHRRSSRSRHSPGRDRGKVYRRNRLDISECFLTNYMQTNNTRNIFFSVEVTFHGISDIFLQLFQVIRFCKDGLSRCPCGVATLRAFFYHEYQLFYLHFHPSFLVSLYMRYYTPTHSYIFNSCILQSVGSERSLLCILL